MKQNDVINVGTFTRVTNEELLQYEALVCKIIKEGGFGNDLSFDEKMAAGMIGAASGIESYDPSQETTRAFWIAWNVKKAILDEARRSLRQKRYSKDEKCRRKLTEEYETRQRKLAEEYETEQGDESALKIRDLDETKKEKILESAMRALSDEERLCVQRIVFDSWTQKQFALDRGVSQSWVSRLWLRSIAKMRDKIGDLDDWL